jgi:hypothetical protein
MTVHELLEKLPLTSVNLEQNRSVTGVFCCDLLSVAMARAPGDAAWVTVIGNANVVAVAHLAEVSCVVIAEGYSFDEAAVAAAKGKVTLLRSDLPVYETAASIGALL